MAEAPPEALEDIVARVAPDRYVAALFAPRERRAALMALYAFDHEVARIAEIVHEPMVGHIRLGWWREQIGVIYAGGVVHAPVAVALAEAVRARGLPRDLFDAYLDARAYDFDEAPFEDEAALERYAVAVSGGIMRLGVAVLGGGGEAAAREAGIAFEYARILASLGAEARRRHCRLPLDGLAGAEDLFAGRATPALRAVVVRLVMAADRALAELGRQKFSTRVTPALAPATVARWILRLARRADFDPFQDGRALPAWQRVARIALANLTWRI